MINFLISEAVSIFYDTADFPVSITSDGEFFYILTSENQVIKIDLASNIISKTSTNSYYAIICYCDTKKVFLAVSKTEKNTIYLLDKDNFEIISKIYIKNEAMNIYDICISECENIIKVCTDCTVIDIDFNGRILKKEKSKKFYNLCACTSVHQKMIITAKINLGVDLFIENSKDEEFKILSCLNQDFSVKSMTFFENSIGESYIFCLAQYKNCAFKIIKIHLCEK